MTRYVKTLSYLFAAMAGVCFVSGLAVLSELGVRWTVWKMHSCFWTI